MDNQETKDGKSCCGKGHCCGGKALVVLALLGVGALGGYLVAHRGAAAAAPAVQTPAK